MGRCLVCRILRVSTPFSPRFTLVLLSIEFVALPLTRLFIFLPTNRIKFIKLQLVFTGYNFYSV